MAAMVLVDSVVRHLPGVLGDADSAEQDSFVQGLLDCPHYTRRKCLMVKPCPGFVVRNHADIQRCGFSSRWAERGCAGRIYWPSAI